MSYYFTLDFQLIFDELCEYHLLNKKYKIFEKILPVAVACFKVRLLTLLFA